MEYQDYYAILGVERDADEKTIKRAYRKLARQYHPDLNPGDDDAEERFKEINEAYEVLSDAEKRQKYDQLGAAWHNWERTGRKPGDFDWSKWGRTAPPGARANVRYGTPEDLQDLFGGASPFSDFFSQLFGGLHTTPRGQASGVRGGARPQRGRDYEQEAEISLREAYEGTTRLLEMRGRKLRVKIPAGTRTGTRIRLTGKGEPGMPGGQSGDLYLRLKVMPDPQFEQKGNDLYVTVPVALYVAVLGGEVRVPTLSGAVKLTIPRNTQNGRVFRLRGKGMPKRKNKGQFGDLYARIAVQLPTDLTQRQTELFKELQEIARAEANA